MKRISRREFVQLCAGSAAGVSVLSLLGPYITSAFGKATGGKPVVLWLQGASCTGCSVSLLNSVEPGSPSIDKVVLDVIALSYHHNIMAASGQLAMDHLFDTAEKYKGQFFLVVEGGVPTKDNGYFCTIGDKSGKHITMLHALKEIGGRAAAVIAAGTCAAYGGIPAGNPNVTGVVGVKEALPGKPVINIPNCPMHPDAFLGTVTYVLTYGDIPALDAHGRPTMFYGRTVHDNCVRRQDFFAERFAGKLGDPGCLYLLGCKGPLAYSDCANRGWNNNTSWCVKAGAPCMACAEPGFPDEFSPLYGRMPLGIDFNLVAAK